MLGKGITSLPGRKMRGPVSDYIKRENPEDAERIPANRSDTCRVPGR
jgi:hypothetical protein